MGQVVGLVISACQMYIRAWSENFQYFLSNHSSKYQWPINECVDTQISSIASPKKGGLNVVSIFPPNSSFSPFSWKLWQNQGSCVDMCSADGGDVCTFKILFPFGNNAKILQFWLSVLKINMWGLSINDDTNLERRGKDLSKGDVTS